MVKLKNRSMASYMKCKVTVLGDVRALVLFHEFFIHVKVGSGKLKIDSVRLARSELDRPRI